MRNKFNYSAVHKNNTRVRELRKVTEQGAKALREAYEDAKLRNAHREELLGGEQHE